MRCEHNGDVQKCLDELINSNNDGMLWEKYVAIRIIFDDMADTQERIELREFKKKYEIAHRPQDSDNSIETVQTEETEIAGGKPENRYEKGRKWKPKSAVSH